MGIKSTESKQQNLQEEKSKLERSERKSLTGENDQIWPKSGEKDRGEKVIKQNAL